MESDELPAAFRQHWDELHDAETFTRLGGGELKDVCRIDCEDEAYSLRIYTPEVSRDDVASELALVSPFAERLPEVPATVETTDGAQLAIEHGRVAVLTSFVEGERPERTNPAHRRAAAEMLARLHGVAANIERPAARTSYPAWRALDWQTNRWWAWPSVERYLRKQPAALAEQVWRRVGGELAALPDTFAALSALDLPAMPIHNDFFPGNLIERDGHIVGVVDWDECMVDWRALELANASCEFASSEEQLGGDGDLSVDAALVRTFLDDYVRAGGEVLDRERLAMLRLRRTRLLWETLYELGRACRGSTLDWPYLWGNLGSLDGVDDHVFERE